MKTLALGSCAFGALIAAAAPAAGAEFAVSPQELQPALQQFAAQGDQQVLFSSAAVAGKSTPGFTGDAAPETALQQLLSGTDLVWSKTTDGALLVMTQAEAQARRPQFAQAAEAGGSEVEALIVTAQKREEDIQDVPIAISAFTQETLERTLIAGGPDLMTQVPNMTFTKTNFASYSIQIRGIGTQAISATTDPAVAVAFNNSAMIRNHFFEQEFYDLQRVEVLRGPQGTLYGRNATAGVVNVLTAKPKHIFEAKLSADIANYSSTRLEGMVNVPLVDDKLSLRLAGAWTKRDGYVTNEVSGQQIDGRDLWSTRLTLGFEPTDRISASSSGSTSRKTTTGCAQASSSARRTSSRPISAVCRCRRRTRGAALAKAAAAMPSTSSHTCRRAAHPPRCIRRSRSRRPTVMRCPSMALWAR